MQKCGYGEIRNRQGEVSYIRAFGRTGYPRFHVYMEAIDEGFRVNLHLDQKKASYSGNTAHSGEYEGPVVEQEAARIALTMKQLER